MKIGVTERGDAGIDFSWIPLLKTVDGAILITKKMSDAFIRCVMAAETPVILHCTCTGWGSTWMEPNVPFYDVQLDFLRKLLDMGFPADRTVLRLDPVIPNEEGLERAQNVLEYAKEILPEKFRVRFSVVDDYPHVRQRMADAGHGPLYENTRGMTRYRADEWEKRAVAELLFRYPFSYEACAEDWAAQYEHITCTGCVNKEDIIRMGLDPSGMPLWENQQGRKDCHCLTCKTELLTNKKRCSNKCMYCYWHD